MSKPPDFPLSSQGAAGGAKILIKFKNAKPLRAAGANVTQMHYAKDHNPGDGIYSYRETRGLKAAGDAGPPRNSTWKASSRYAPDTHHPEFVRQEVALGRAIALQHQPPRNRADDNRENFLVKINANVGNSA
jgi:thiamine biosynthesis protein ThiC